MAHLHELEAERVELLEEVVQRRVVFNSTRVLRGANAEYNEALNRPRIRISYLLIGTGALP